MPVSFSHFAGKRRFLILIGLIVIVLVLVAVILCGWSEGRPNVILVTFDTTRADHLGAYGYEKGLTSDFDDFARQGVVFEWAYAPAPITLPSHATMLTGLYPPEHGLRANGAGRLGDNVPFLPEILRKHGYDTAAFVAAFVLDSTFGLDRGFDVYDDDLSNTPIPAAFNERRRDGLQVVEAAISWLRKRRSGPFFCWIHLYDAHELYDARPKQFGEQFVDSPYDAGIAVESRAFGRLLAFLKARQLDKRTLIVVAGDHGEGLGEHSESEHGMLVYNSTLRVPLVFSGPQCRPSGRVNTVVSLVDLMPTVLDLLRIPVPAHVSGRSLRNALNGGPIPSVDCYAEAVSAFDLNRLCPLFALISDRLKYIETTRPELYNLQDDPGEERNLADSGNEDCQRMRDRLEVVQQAFVPSAIQNLKLSNEDRSRLAALGYVSEGKLPEPNQASNPEVLRDIKDVLPVLAKYEEARHFAMMGNANEAVPLLEELVRRPDAFPAVFVLLGDCLGHGNQLDEAAAAYRTALEKRPDTYSVRFSLAKLLVRQGHVDQGAEEFRQIIKQDPDNAPAHFELAQLLLGSQRVEDAVAQLKQAVEIAPEFSAANLQLGLVFAKHQRFKEAETYFEQALKHEPNNAVAHASLSTTLIVLNQVDGAIEHGKKAVELNPNSFDIRFNLGMLLSSQKRYQDALEQFREARKLQPDDPRLAKEIHNAESALKK